MLTNFSIRPIPKYMLVKIQKLDRKLSPEQKGIRMYSYLTTLKKQLVKVTVAVKNYKKKWYCKQVAVHGTKMNKCYIKDMEYCYIGMGFRVGWYAEGLTKHKKWFESDYWYDADSKYYNPFTKVVNLEYLSKFNEYKYSGHEYFNGKCIIEYLKLYSQYPQTEYLLKLGLCKLHDSITILKYVAKDKKFCKWLALHRAEIADGSFYISTIMQAYKANRPLKQIQAFEECKKRLNTHEYLRPIKEMFKGQELLRFFTYLEEQNSEPNSYLDYLKACNYLGLDMSLPKNRYPHNFKLWHDIRIDEYATLKALADETERTELYEKFAAVAEKYLALQNCKKSSYAVLIATNPSDLIREGEILKHCVGRMGYDQKMVREETLIFFVRDIEKPDTPFVTVEYSLKNKKVLQCYGYNSEKPEENVLTFVNRVWLAYANRTIKKLAA